MDVALISTSREERAAAWLLSAEAVRLQAGLILAAGRRGELAHFAVDDGRLDFVAGYVADTMAINYPDLAIPYHARWRHFVVDGDDRWQRFGAQFADDPLERARVRIDLVVLSVLLDAGAGVYWGYEDAVSGRRMVRSEGLAIASLDGFCAGAFGRGEQGQPCSDWQVLAELGEDDLARMFQADEDNPLAGLDGRVALLNRLGVALAGLPPYFGVPGRIGNLADYFVSIARDGTLPADRILSTALKALGAIWPGRLALGGVNLGDCWKHRAAVRDDAASGYVPFHKLSQWLSYSLVEPLQELGLNVTGLDALTGLAEYRNGGLLVDAGLLRAKHGGVSDDRHRPDSEIIVEWRALTVALLDEIAEAVRCKVGKSAEELPLASVLEGGTWAAGRRIAAEKRDGGGPPINILSDGSVF
jgi:hypothetical protein